MGVNISCAHVAAVKIVCFNFSIYKQLKSVATHSFLLLDKQKRFTKRYSFIN